MEQARRPPGSTVSFSVIWRNLLQWRSCVTKSGRTGVCCGRWVGTNRHSAFSSAPRIFIVARPAWSTTSAQAPVCQPHATHRTLLSRNTQNPRALKTSLFEAISHEASNVTAIAAHCNASNQGNAELLTMTTPDPSAQCNNPVVCGLTASATIAIPAATTSASSIKPLSVCPMLAMARLRPASVR